MPESFDPATQSLARDLTAEEKGFADALMAAFAGTHEFDGIVAALETGKVKAPSGDPAAWSVAKLERELRAINASLDGAYRGNLPEAVEIF